jgi:two-component system chemotaxis response regulator CheY
VIGVKILIADDSRVMRQIVSRTLRQAGYDGHDLVEAADGRQAYETIVSEKPDLVLSDWNMPELTGVEVLRQLRANGVQVPFGFVTSESSEEMRTTAEAAGALFLITKPFTADSFRDALDPILG